MKEIYFLFIFFIHFMSFAACVFITMMGNSRQYVHYEYLSSCIILTDDKYDEDVDHIDISSINMCHRHLHHRSPFTFPQAFCIVRSYYLGN